MFNYDIEILNSSMSVFVEQRQLQKLHSTQQQRTSCRKFLNYLRRRKVYILVSVKILSCGDSLRGFFLRF